MPLRNKKTLITGAARGIGLAIAEEMIRQAAAVPMCFSLAGDSSASAAFAFAPYRQHGIHDQHRKSGAH